MKIFLFIIAFSIPIAANAANDPSSLQERMSDKEFNETGLEKLTDRELSNLNDWLRSHSIAIGETASAQEKLSVQESESTSQVASDVSTQSKQTREDRRGLKEEPAKDDEVINGTIVGTFNGWRHKGTLFKLTNGMIWKQTENDTFAIRAVENPEVTITRGFMGGWRMSVVGHVSAVRVKRVK